MKKKILQNHIIQNTRNKIGERKISIAMNLTGVGRSIKTVLVAWIGNFMLQRVLFMYN